MRIKKGPIKRCNCKCVTFPPIAVVAVAVVAVVANGGDVDDAKRICKSDDVTSRSNTSNVETTEL